MSEWEHRYLNGNFYEVGNIYRCQDISINDQFVIVQLEPMAEVILVVGFGNNSDQCLSSDSGPIE